MQLLVLLNNFFIADPHLGNVVKDDSDVELAGLYFRDDSDSSSSSEVSSNAMIDSDYKRVTTPQPTEPPDEEYEKDLKKLEEILNETNRGRQLWNALRQGNFNPEELKSAVEFLDKSESLPFQAATTESPVRKLNEAIIYGMANGGQNVSVQPVHKKQSETEKSHDNLIDNLISNNQMDNLISNKNKENGKDESNETGDNYDSDSINIGNQNEENDQGSIKLETLNTDVSQDKIENFHKSNDKADDYQASHNKTLESPNYSDLMQRGFEQDDNEAQNLDDHDTENIFDSIKKERHEPSEHLQQKREDSEIHEHPTLPGVEDESDEISNEITNEVQSSQEEITKQNNYINEESFNKEEKNKFSTSEKDINVFDSSELNHPEAIADDSENEDEERIVVMKKKKVIVVECTYREEEILYPVIVRKRKSKTLSEDLENTPFVKSLSLKSDEFYQLNDISSSNELETHERSKIVRYPHDERQHNQIAMMQLFEQYHDSFDNDVSYLDKVRAIGLDEQHNGVEESGCTDSIQDE